MQRLLFQLCITLSLSLIGTSTVFADTTRLLRFPDIHNGKVTFVYAGNIYIASTQGGVARRLTSHEGFETFPKFSPDGTKIAYVRHVSKNGQAWNQIFVLDVQVALAKRS